jgi:hypothetical protein
MTEQEKIAYISQELKKLDREGEAYIKALTAALVSLPTPNIPGFDLSGIIGAGGERCL